MRFSYILPDPAGYRTWLEFEKDISCAKGAGYGAVELQITDPIRFDFARVKRILTKAALPFCAFQTGATYAAHGNCLCSPEPAVRRRTFELLKRFVDLAAECHALIVFGSLQGRLTDEPKRDVGAARIAEALQELGACATAAGAVIAFEPVNHLEVGFHNTIAEAATLVRKLNLPSIRLMVDTFHMNIEEKDMLAPLPQIRDILVHVHLSETNRDVPGAGHLDTAGFLRTLRKINYDGYVSIGVYNSRRSRQECAAHCMGKIQHYERT